MNSEGARIAPEAIRAFSGMGCFVTQARNHGTWIISASRKTGYTRAKRAR